MAMFGVEHLPESRGGIRAAFLKGLARFMYSGSIWRSDADVVDSPYVGVMEDSFGPSSVSEVECDTDHLVFTKIYRGRVDEIRYTFDVREGSTLVGRWSDPRVGDGIARCLITEVPDEFFVAGSIKYALGERIAPDESRVSDGEGSIF